VGRGVGGVSVVGFCTRGATCPNVGGVSGSWRTPNPPPCGMFPNRGGVVDVKGCSMPPVSGHLLHFYKRGGWSFCSGSKTPPCRGAAGLNGENVGGRSKTPMSPGTMFSPVVGGP
jgi:hypothetical protein